MSPWQIITIPVENLTEGMVILTADGDLGSTELHTIDSILFRDDRSFGTVADITCGDFSLTNQPTSWEYSILSFRDNILVSK